MPEYAVSRKIWLTSCDSKKELSTLLISVICAGVVPARKFFLRLQLGNENSALYFSDRSFGFPLGSWTSVPSGHGCFPEVSKALTKVLTRDIRANDPRKDVCGISGPRTSSLGCFFVREAPILIF